MHYGDPFEADDTDGMATNLGVLVPEAPIIQVAGDSAPIAVEVAPDPDEYARRTKNSRR